MASDAHESRDLLEQDMAAHETRFNGEVHGARNQALAAEALQQLEQQRAEAKAVPVTPAPPEPERFVQHKVLDGRAYTIEKEPDRAPMYRSATEFEANVMRHAQPRIELLLSKLDEGPLGTPSWRTRTLAAMYFKVKSLEARKSNLIEDANIFEQVFQQDLYELLEESNKVFGDWRRDDPQKLIITVTR